MDEGAPVCPRGTKYAASTIAAFNENDSTVVVVVGLHELRLTLPAAERLLRQLRRLPSNRDAIL